MPNILPDPGDDSPEARKPQRIQRKRTKGWRMPEGAVYVGRGSKWGNPFTRWVIRETWDDNYGPCDDIAWRHEAVASYRREVLNGDGWFPPTPEDAQRDLRGRDLACWCALEDAEGRPVPCHADVLLELANTSADAILGTT